LETAGLTRDYLARFYGDRVQVEYADVGEPQAAERHKALIAKAEQGYCVYPLVFMGEDLVSIGNAEYYQVLRFVRRYFKS